LTIKAICFDADGVVINPQLLYAKRLDEEYGITREITADFFGGPFNDCLIGKAHLMDELPPYLNAWGWPHTPEKFLHDWMTTDHVIDERMVEAIRRLRRQGFVCCLTTNQERNRAAYMRAAMGFHNIFDHLFISCEIGAQKPQYAYYQHIENTLCLKKEEILFFDDGLNNVKAAYKFGWHAEVYTTFESFERSLEKYY
jgi:putative hydrolase of the HAD superfamily